MATTTRRPFVATTAWEDRARGALPFRDMSRPGRAVMRRNTRARICPRMPPRLFVARKCSEW
eukprot:5508678-Alexandrium_andersonii.AAC.1